MESDLGIWPRRRAGWCCSGQDGTQKAMGVGRVHLRGWCVQCSILFPLFCLPPDTSLKEKASLISISVAPRLCLMNPNVNDLTRTPTWAPGKFSFRCMTLGYFQPSIFIPHFYLKDKMLSPVIRCAYTWSFKVWSADKSFSVLQGEERSSEVLAWVVTGAPGAQDHLVGFRPSGAGRKAHTLICSVTISNDFFV